MGKKNTTTNLWLKKTLLEKYLKLRRGKIISYRKLRQVVRADNDTIDALVEWLHTREDPSFKIVPRRGATYMETDAVETRLTIKKKAQNKTAVSTVVK